MVTEAARVAQKGSAESSSQTRISRRTSSRSPPLRSSFSSSLPPRVDKAAAENLLAGWAGLTEALSHGKVLPPLCARATVTACGRTRPQRPLLASPSSLPYSAASKSYSRSQGSNSSKPRTMLRMVCCCRGSGSRLFALRRYIRCFLLLVSRRAALTSYFSREMAAALSALAVRSDSLPVSSLSPSGDGMRKLPYSCNQYKLCKYSTLDSSPINNLCHAINASKASSGRGEERVPPS